MNKLAAVLAMGLGLCLGGRVSAQESVITYPVIVPASATSTPTEPAKAVAPVMPVCCNAKEPCRDVKACCAGTGGPCGDAKACTTCAAKKPGHTCCLDKLKCWCCYRALPCGCCCYHCCEGWSHVWAYFPPDRGCCGCGYAASGGCASGACASGTCPAGGCSVPH